jgi:hypothetical protein
MDLQILYSDIRDYALNTQGVNSFTIGDPYLVWNSLHMTYGCFNAALNYVEYEDNDCKFYMTLYYGDKLLNDSSNVYEVQNTGFNAIRNVVSHLVDNYELEGVETLRIYPFTQKFADALAGAYADVVVYVPLDNCFNFDKE